MSLAHEIVWGSGFHGLAVATACAAHPCGDPTMQEQTRQHPLQRDNRPLLVGTAAVHMVPLATTHQAVSWHIAWWLHEPLAAETSALAKHVCTLLSAAASGFMYWPRIHCLPAF